MVHFKTRAPGQLSADQYRLVKSAAPQTRGMERHGNDDCIAAALGDKFLQMIRD